MRRLLEELQRERGNGGGGIVGREEVGQGKGR